MGGVGRGGDAAARVLAVAISMLPAERNDWGAAMRGELEHIAERPARLRFSLGCVLAAMRAPRPPGGAQGAVIVRFVLASTACAAALVAFAFVRYPGLRTGAGTWLDVAAFGLVLVGYGVTTLSIVRATSNPPMVTRIAIPAGVAAAVLPFLVVVTSWASTPLTSALMFLAFVLASAATGVAAVRYSGSLGVSRGVVFVAAMVAGLTVFLLWVGSTLVDDGRPYDPGLIRDFEASGSRDLATYAVKDNLGSAMMLLLVVPLVVAAIGSASVAFAGSRSRRGTAETPSAG